MVFSSIEFLFFFLPIFLIAYYIVPFKLKNTVLLIASLVFYSWGEPKYIVLMLIASLVGWLGGLLQPLAKTQTGKKAVLAVSVILNLLILGYYKYAFFFVTELNRFLHTDINAQPLALPIGISFFTFQIMSYTIDVYRGEAEVQKNFFTFMTYVSMFPQLIAGPIVRYTTVCAELKTRKIDLEGYAYGMRDFLYGLYKKVLIANNIGILWESVKVSQDPSFLSAWLGAVAFSLQLYFDFSGYADMAIGMGRMLGFKYNENFNYPYSAVSITDFWRRWHMSLSFWFRDYVYIPLGGSRCSAARHIFNMFVVWALTGLWHGAAYNFVIWGVYYFVFLVLEKYVWGKALEKLPAIVGHIYTLLIVITGFTIFVFDDMGALGAYLGHMFMPKSFVDARFFEYAAGNAALIAAACILAFPIYPKFRSAVSRFEQKPWFTLGAAVCHTALFLLSCAYIISASYNPFLYFRF